jgi:GNAT superfamily N-acetyltransferase
LGDLDDFFWPKTTFYGKIRGQAVSHVATLYFGRGLPILLVLGPEGFFTSGYCHSLAPRLPDQFYAHFSPGLEDHFQRDYEIIGYGEHFKMSLIDAAALGDISPESCHRLDNSHLPELEELYSLSYPGNAFDPDMVLTGKCYGCSHRGKLVSVGGVHVYSLAYQVAALGNITTLPEYRNKGYGKIVTSCLCRDLLQDVKYIGLNVKADNIPALQLYRSLGFHIDGKYGEFSLKKRF